VEFGDCLVGVKNEDCEGNATMVIWGFSLRNFNFFTSSDYCIILVHAEMAFPSPKLWAVIMCCNA
jgi:hypothetical protein